MNFAVTPYKAHVIDIVTATETACRSLNQGDANELRAKVLNLVEKGVKVRNQNVNKEEWKAIMDLKKMKTL